MLADLDKKQTRVFNKIKKSLMKTFINPNYGVKMLIDVVAMEYLRYSEATSSTSKADIRSKISKNMVDILSELDLTPKSRKTSEVSKTLSQIFQTLAEDKPGISNKPIKVENITPIEESISPSGVIIVDNEEVDECPI